ncbi:MAG TPA: hypothetical protein VFX19_03970 [Dehalococcoidia bacterium]|nr:hypothetical protein [Dehalococcoidia bacterium]
MDKGDSRAREIIEAQAARRAYLAGLEETQGWAHHVIDLDTGKEASTALDRPITPVSRAARLSALGNVFDPSIFGGPSYRLTARRNYQASPLAYLIAGHPSAIDSYDDTISWDLPQDGSMNSLSSARFVFTESPQGRSVVSVAISAAAWQGRTGNIVVDAFWGPATVRVPVGQVYISYIIDLTFVPLGGRQTDVILRFEGAVHTVVLRSVSFHLPQPDVIAADI